jgi:hypothetical protein
MTPAGGHFHLLAVSGRITQHSHSGGGKPHEHDGKRRYSRSGRGIEAQRLEYLAAFAAHTYRRTGLLLMCSICATSLVPIGFVAI